MHHHYYHGLEIFAWRTSDRWKWKIVLPLGGILNAQEEYLTPEQAIAAGKQWINTETAFNALNPFLCELCSHQIISQQEYCNLMESFIGITQSC